jgi:hypothetical protein
LSEEERITILKKERRKANRRAMIFGDMTLLGSILLLAGLLCLLLVNSVAIPSILFVVISVCALTCAVAGFVGSRYYGKKTKQLRDQLKEMMVEEETIPLKTDTVSVLSALLDFYADRASGFASLFVASIFGLVTLSAIIQSFNDSNPWWYALAGVPYFAFVISGYYTWNRFRYWAGIAHSIQCFGLLIPHKSIIEKIKCYKEVEGKTEETDLYSFITNEGEKQKDEFIKKEILDRGYHSFTFLYLILVVFLTIIIYWRFLRILGLPL